VKNQGLKGQSEKNEGKNNSVTNFAVGGSPCRAIDAETNRVSRTEKYDLFTCEGTVGTASHLITSM